MDSLLREVAEATFTAITIVAQWKLCGWAMEWKGLPGGAAMRRTLGVWRVVGGLAMSIEFVWHHPAVNWYLVRSPAASWFRGMSIAWGACVMTLFPIAWISRRLPEFSPKRRRLLRAGGVALVAAPFVVTGYGLLVERSRFRTTEIDIAIPNLPADLDGLRLVQLSDIHLSTFLSESELDRVVDMANETKANLALITGDLITMHDGRLSSCLQRLKRVRADAGTLGCFGNHELRAECQERAKTEGAALGLDFLRREARGLRFGDATLNVAGVDHQRSSQAYLTGAEQLKQPGAVNVLLSHNPDVFDVAAEQGWDLTLAGHTHGGQVSVEILEKHLNVARFVTPYVYGLYRQGKSSIYVTRGIGTVGVPARVGAPPEVALIRLCAT